MKDINSISHGISKSGSLATDTLERGEGIQEACMACDTFVSDLQPFLSDLSKKLLHHSNTVIEHKLSNAEKCAATTLPHQPAEYSKKYRPGSRYTLLKTRRVRFRHTFPR